MSYFTAQYSGTCDACEEPIKPGQKVGYVGDEVRHAGCIEGGVTRVLRKVVEVCKLCWLEKPCGCEDGQ